jgi:hypothetical protein
LLKNVGTCPRRSPLRRRPAPRFSAMVAGQTS